MMNQIFVTCLLLIAFIYKPTIAQANYDKWVGEVIEELQSALCSIKNSVEYSDDCDNIMKAYEIAYENIKCCNRFQLLDSESYIVYNPDRLEVWYLKKAIKECAKEIIEEFDNTFERIVRYSEEGSCDEKMKHAKKDC